MAEEGIGFTYNTERLTPPPLLLVSRREGKGVPRPLEAFCCVPSEVAPPQVAGRARGHERSEGRSVHG